MIAALALGIVHFQTGNPGDEPKPRPQATLPDGFAQEFRRYYDQRRTPGRSAEMPTERPDPAIVRDLDLIIGHASRLLKQGASPPQVQRLLESAVDHVIGKSSGLPESHWADVDCYGRMRLQIESINGIRIIVSTMGAVSRMAAWDRHWNPIALPEEFLWNYRWQPKATGLPSGLILISEAGIEAMGMRDGVQLLWLDIRGGKAKIVGRVMGETTLDFLEPVVRGNRASLITVDNPRTFSVTAAEATLMRERTWDASDGRPKLVRNRALQPGLRLVDQTIWNAWHAPYPDRRQRTIRSLWPENDYSLSCSEKWSHGKGVVMIGPAVRFDLSRNSKGKLVVVGVRHHR